MTWELGFISILLTVALPLAYLLFRQARTFGAWMQRDDAPKERVGAYLLITAIMGFILGGFIQPFYNCYQTGQSLFSCLT